MTFKLIYYRAPISAANIALLCCMYVLLCKFILVTVQIHSFVRSFIHIISVLLSLCLHVGNPSYHFIPLHVVKYIWQHSATHVLWQMALCEDVVHLFVKQRWDLLLYECFRVRVGASVRVNFRGRITVRLSIPMLSKLNYTFSSQHVGTARF